MFKLKVGSYVANKIMSMKIFKNMGNIYDIYKAGIYKYHTVNAYKCIFIEGGKYSQNAREKMDEASQKRKMRDSVGKMA